MQQVEWWRSPLSVLYKSNIQTWMSKIGKVIKTLKPFYLIPGLSFGDTCMLYAPLPHPSASWSASVLSFPAFSFFHFVCFILFFLLPSLLYYSSAATFVSTLSHSSPFFLCVAHPPLPSLLGTFSSVSSSSISHSSLPPPSRWAQQGFCYLSFLCSPL